MSQPANDEFSQHLSDEESNHEDASDTGAAPKQQQQVIPQTTAISNIKLLILKKEEYDIWAMEMEHYLEYIDNEVWKVIQNGNSKKRISTGKDGIVRVLSPVTAAEIQAVEKERKAKNILLMAIPKEHMRRFHGMDDAKEIWEAIRTRFGGNANSKKMQKAVFKQQFEAFKISNSEGLEKGYDRFQQLLSQLEAHGAEVSTEDANHKFLRSLPPAWSNLAMTMRTNPEIDNLSIDDLYNNLRVFEQEIQGASKTSSSAQNVAFVSQSKSSTNKVKSGFSGAYSSCTPSTSSTNIPEKEVLAGFADEVIYSLFAKQTEDLDLLHEDLEQIDDVDIEEMDINWQIAMIAIRMKKFYKKTGRRVRVDGKTPVGFDKKKLERWGSKRKISGLLDNDDGIVNGENITEAEETNHDLWLTGSLKPEISVSDEILLSILLYNPMTVKSYEIPLSTLLRTDIRKYCDYYEKKMAREAEVKRVVNTGNGLTKPVWTNANRINHSNNFVPRSVQLNACRPKFNTVRPNINTGRTNISSGRPKVNTVSPKVNSVRPKQPAPNKTSNSLSPKRPQMNQINQRRDFSSYSSVRRPFAKSTAQMTHTNAVMGSWGSAVKTSASYNWRNTMPNFNYNSGPTFLRTKHPLKNMVDRGIFYSGCSGHMTGNKYQLEDFEEFNGGSVTFGGSKGYISGKGTSQTPESIASEEKDEEVELIVVPSAVKIPEEKDVSRTSSKNSKIEETLTEPQIELKDSSIDSLEDNSKIQAFRRELEDIALKHLGTTSTPSVNTGSQPVNTGRLDHDDSLMPEL
ncbi:hypothetical protein Tco_0884399, partial [Tanacetum coccineum]